MNITHQMIRQPQKKAIEQSDRLNKQAAYTRAGMEYIWLNWFMIRDFIMRRSLIKLMKQALAGCRENCIQADCMRELVKPLKKMRENYLKLINTYESRNGSALILHMARKGVDDADDLVEDFCIFSDSEIRSDINRIGSLL